jgi:hypothetical protein
MGVIGPPLYSGGAMKNIYRYLSHISIKNEMFDGP